MTKTPLPTNYLDIVERVLGVDERLGQMSQYATTQDYQLSRKRMIREGYQQVITGLARMIDATPTSELRNSLTDLNIAALLLQPKIEEEIK